MSEPIQGWRLRNGYFSRDQLPESVVVLSYTEKSLLVRDEHGSETRQKWRSDHSNYYLSWDQAAKELEDRLKIGVKQAESKIKDCTTKLTALWAEMKRRKQNKA